MHESSPPVFFLPSWARIGVVCLMFTCAVLSAWRGFFRFEWVPWFCMGLYWLLYFPKQTR